MHQLLSQPSLSPPALGRAAAHVHAHVHAHTKSERGMERGKPHQAADAEAEVAHGGSAPLPPPSTHGGATSVRAATIVGVSCS